MARANAPAAQRRDIVNLPANPIGSVTPKAEITALVQGLAAHPDLAVMSDETTAQ